LTSATIRRHGRVQLDVQARARFERLVEDQADAADRQVDDQSIERLVGIGDKPRPTAGLSQR